MRWPPCGSPLPAISRRSLRSRARWCGSRWPCGRRRRSPLRARPGRAGANIAPLHPKHPEARLRHRRIERRRERQRQHTARLRRRDDAVVPEPRRSVVRIALGFVLIADRRLEFFFLDLGPAAAVRFDIVALTVASTEAACSPPITEMREF